jgi:endonuclease/exonuclease/phosphatase family metal-dependent hydrolase
MAEQTCRFSLNVLTINIHKGFTTFNRRFMLPALRDAIRSVSADIVCLQEVTGAHEIHSLQIENWPDRSHYEFLADTLWSEYAYGRNAVYPEGHHGNAVLSAFLLNIMKMRYLRWQQRKARSALLPHRSAAKRGATSDLCAPRPARGSVRPSWRCWPAGQRPARRQPVVVAGDFNDWRQQANRVLKAQAGLEEIFTRAHGRPARTFPARFPLLRLDRIYVKNAHASHPTALPFDPGVICPIMPR